MAGQSERREEREAKWVVAALVGGRPERHVPPGHDYDIHVGERVLALEVTTSTVPEVKAFDAAIGARTKELSPPQFRTNWALSTRAASPGNRGTDLTEVFDKAPTLLRTLEDSGLPAFGRGYEPLLDTAPPGARDAIASLVRLGLIAGSSMGRPIGNEQPVMAVGTVGEGGTVDANDVKKTVERVAKKKARQLGSADADERHLFIIAEATDYAAYAALTIGPEMPRQSPTLPPSIDTIWVGAWAPFQCYGCDISPIWRVTPPRAWERVQAPDAHSYAASLGDDLKRSVGETAREAVRRELNQLAGNLRTSSALTF